MKEKEINVIANRLKQETIVPFWMWNDELNKDKLIVQLRDIKSKGINQVIVHPRFGLETSYLSEEWFDIFSLVLEEAKRQRMGIWIYDELNWPSGYGGGKVLAHHPEFQASHIVKTNELFEVRKTNWKPAYSNTYYVDVLNPKATDAFLENVYEQYWQRFGEYFGGTIQGFFTDEPGLYNNFAGSDPDSLPWSESLPAFFKQRTGYELEPILPLIWEGTSPESVEARVNFWETISDLYRVSYFKRIKDWCHRRGVAFIGHVLIEENMVDTVKTQGNFFTAMEELDFSGYDLLGRLEAKTIIAAKLAKSVCKLYDLHGVTAETFGIFGWDLDLKEMKRVAKWQVEMGLDVLIPHALFYSLRGRRYDDCPPSFFVAKYWSHFDKFVKFVHNQKNKRREKQPSMAIYYPIESVWGLLLPQDSSWAEKVDWAFQLASFACYNNKIDFDYVNSDFILKIGLKKYQHLILPQTEIISKEVLNQILDFAKHGGEIIIIGDCPSIATKSEDLLSIKSTCKSIRDLSHNIPLPNNLNTERRIQKVKSMIKNTISSKFPPIWIARGVRIAKLFGYKKPISLKQSTEIDRHLKKILHFSKKH